MVNWGQDDVEYDLILCSTAGTQLRLTVLLIKSFSRPSKLAETSFG